MSRLRFRKRRANRGTLSGLERDQRAYPRGRCMRIAGQDELVTLAEWKRWFRCEGKYQLFDTETMWRHAGCP